MSLATVKDPTRRMLLGATGVVCSTLLLAALDLFTFGLVSLPALIPPFGASLMIVFFLPESPIGRAWNVVMGQVASALVANGVLLWLPGVPVGVQAALAVAGA